MEKANSNPIASARKVISLFMAKLGVNWGDAREMIQPLLVIGRKTPSSTSGGGARQFAARIHHQLAHLRVDLGVVGVYVGQGLDQHRGGSQAGEPFVVR